MRSLLIIILSLLIACYAFGQNYPDSGFTNKAEAKNLIVNGLKEGKWCEYNNGDIDFTTDTNSLYYVLTIYANGKETGLVRWYYRNGKLNYEAYYKYGLRNGIAKQYYENGNIMNETTYIDGKLNGLCKRYCTNGKIKDELIYKNDDVIETKDFDKKGNEIK